MSAFFDLVARLQEQINALDVILAGDDTSTVTVAGINKPSVSRDIKLRLAQIQAMVQGSLAYETKAEMDAAGAPPSGELARVWKDATESNNGIYGYSGGAWVKSIYDPEQYIDNRFKNRVLIPSGRFPVFDPTGALGTANTLYLPVRLYHQQGASSTNQDVANAVSATLPGYCEVTIGSGSEVTFVYFDLSTNSYVAEIYSGGLDLADAKKGDAIPVFITWGDGVWSLWEHKRADDAGAQLCLFRKGPMIIDDGKLYVPEFYVYGSDLGFNLLAPSTGKYFELDASTSSSTAIAHLVDMAAVERGETAENCIKSVSGAGPGYRGGFKTHVFARTIGGVLNTPYPAAGDVPGGTAYNMCPHTKVADGLDRLFGNAAFVDVTDTDLLALGITRGFCDTGASRSYAGMTLPDKRGSGRAFFRYYVQSPTANNFGTPQLYVWNESSFTAQVFPTVLRQLNDNVAEVIASFEMPAGDQLFFYVGAEHGTAGNLVICGVQFHSGEQQAYWIRRDDMPSDVPLVSLQSQIVGDVGAFNFAYPDDMFMVEGRPLPLYPANIFQERSETQAVACTYWNRGREAENGYYPLVITERETMLIDPQYCGALSGLEFRRYGPGRANNRYAKDLTTHVAPATQSGTVRVLSIGDSLTNREQPIKLGRKLEHMGLTVDMVGTMQNNGGGSYNGEAREGREWADFIYEHTDAVAPVDAGTEATYLGYGDSTKQTYNPFLKVPDSNDTANKAGYIYNGYIFDMAFYLSRFSFADPDFVTINLGTNDASQQDQAETLAQVQRGFEVIYNQTREALPNAHILILVSNVARADAGNSRWDQDRWPTLVVEQMKLVQAARDAGDSKVWFVPCYAHMSIETGWSTTIEATDTGTGMESRKITDVVHFNGHVREQYAEVVTAWVAGLYAGV